jgi:C4-dicarboxylate-specific signal transduction histidine kinase
LVEPKLLHDIVLAEDVRLWDEFHTEAFAHPERRSLQFRIRRADGQIRWIQHHSQPVTDDKSRFLGLRASNRDFTADKEAEQDRQRLREELARVTRITTADHLAASLAHELRQPLTAILSNAEAADQFLRHNPPDLGEVCEALQDIARNGERASHVIQRLRALYHRVGKERGQVDLNQLVEDTIALLRSELVLHHVSYRKELVGQRPVVSANRIEIQQVLLNLIFNARDAVSENPPGNRQLTVCTARDGPNQVRVSVSDSGTGIDAETAAHLFQPFFTTKDSGMGMGLAISHSIIEAHDGRLWAEPNSAGGATFHFTLPATEAIEL